MSIQHFVHLLALLAIACTTYAQDYDSLLVRRVDSLKQELSILRQELQAISLEDVSAVELDDEVERLEERFEERIKSLEQKIGAVLRAAAPTAFNPRTTVFINAAARIDDQPVTEEESGARIDDRLFLRSVEVDFRAPVDPYAEAVAILAVEDEAGTGFELDPEEVYGIIKRIPILETAPLGMKVRIGKYRAAFGVNNRLHLHDNPWISRPLVISKYLGSEHGDFFESGYNPVGIDVEFFLPSPAPNSTLEMNVDILRAGELALANGSGDTQPAFLAHLNWFKDWHNEHALTLGLSGYYERSFPQTRLLGFDLTYKWRPAERGSFRSFVAGGELFLGDHGFQNELDIDGDGVADFSREVRQTPVGWFAYAQYQLSWWLFAGLRYDRVQEPGSTEFTHENWSGYLSYYTTDFLRFRLGYEHRSSNHPGSVALNTLLFEVNFVFGSHPIEPYWVNR